MPGCSYVSWETKLTEPALDPLASHRVACFQALGLELDGSERHHRQPRPRLTISEEGERPACGWHGALRYPACPAGAGEGRANKPWGGACSKAFDRTLCRYPPLLICAASPCHADHPPVHALPPSSLALSPFLLHLASVPSFSSSVQGALCLQHAFREAKRVSRAF